jgi:uncharacterized protein (DUF58 family)
VIVAAPSRLPTTLEELLPPDLAGAISRLDVFSRKILQGKLPGERRSKRRGRSVEFDDYRPYVPGDDPRHIDWNIVGRLDRLFLKLFREEEDLSLDLVVDCSASMLVGDEPKVVYASRLALALASIGLSNHDRVALAIIGLPASDANPAGVKMLRPVRGSRNLPVIAGALLDALRDVGGASVGADGRGSVDPAARFAEAMRVVSRSRSGRGVSLLLSDFLLPAGYERGLEYFAGEPGTRDGCAVQLLSEGELRPAALRERGLIGDLRLIDAESGRGREVTVTPASITRYQAALTAHNKALHEACARLGVAHVVVSTATPVKDLLLGTLRKGGVLR